MNYVFVPKILTVWRKLKHLSPEKVAVRMDCSRMTVINWEKGRTTPDAKDLCRLASLYNVTIDQFFAQRGHYGSTPAVAATTRR